MGITFLSDHRYVISNRVSVFGFSRSLTELGMQLYTVELSAELWRRFLGTQKYKREEMS